MFGHFGLFSVASAAIDILVAGSVAPACTPDQRAQALSQGPAYHLTCSLFLQRDDRIVRPLLLQGEASSHLQIQCNGATIGQLTQRYGVTNPTIAIWSMKGNGRWSRPTNVLISNCKINGNVRIFGMGAEGDFDTLRLESRLPNYVQNVQAAAPTDIILQDVSIRSNGSIPLYIGPGSTNIKLINSNISGDAALAVYLDSESADNIIENNVFTVYTKNREMIAIDGSARNIISGNEFAVQGIGGIFLYKNCGERDVVRVQGPVYNKILNNSFYPARSLNYNLALRAIVVGARNGKTASSCPMSESIHEDGAIGNVVKDNIIMSNRR